MTTFRVTTEDLRSFADELARLSSALHDVAGRSLGAGGSGAPPVERALDGFHSHWSSTASLLGEELQQLGQKVSAAADAYQQTDGQVESAASGGC